MRTRTRIYNKVWLGVALALAACSRGDEVPSAGPDEMVAMSFAASVDDVVATRAVTNLEDSYKEFYVTTYKTMPGGTQQTVMPGYEVRFDNTRRWYYDGIEAEASDGTTHTQYLKFWDASAESYTFVAVTPIPNNAADAPYAYKGTEVEIGNDGNITITGIKGNMASDDSENSSNAPEWMVARTVRDFTAKTDCDDIANSQLSILNYQFTEVPLMFHHIFARVDFRAYSASGFITLSKFKVVIPDASSDEIINQGDYSTNGGWTNTAAATKDETNSQQDPKVFGDYTYLDGRVVPEEKENAVLLASHIQIPHHWAADGRKLVVTCEATDGTVYTGVITLDRDNNGEYTSGAAYSGWKQDVHYTYVLRIDAQGATEVILFCVNMNKWQWIEGNSTEDIQTNW